MKIITEPSFIQMAPRPGGIMETDCNDYRTVINSIPVNFIKYLILTRTIQNEIYLRT